MPRGMVQYTYQDDRGIIQVGSNICLELRTDECTVLNSIDRMKEVESSCGFMFWNNSNEGELWIKENFKGKGFSNFIK